ncbi:MAG: hypothetical protein M3362_20670 [Acidobacteriota bacterium]|nr:hypothetical protein [Acidobacteriota bacterium]
MATSFEKDIKPYFTELDRNQMMDSNHTYGVLTLDLWSSQDVQNNWQAIYDAVVTNQSMPPAGSPPDTDGPWDQNKISQFDKDFTAWKEGGFQP